MLKNNSGPVHTCPKCKGQRTKLITEGGVTPPGYEKTPGKSDVFCLLCGHIFTVDSKG